MDPGKQRLFQPGKTSAAQQLCPRLIDYLIIVGRRPNAAARRRRIPNGQNVAAGGLLPGGSVPTHGGTISHPEMLRRYPSENHKDFELARDVVYFCQPEGCLSFSGSAFRQLKRRHLFQEATSFVFLLTEKDTAKVRYGITLNFFLKHGAGTDGRSRPNPQPHHQQQQHSAEPQQQPRPSSSHNSSAGCSANLISLCMMSHNPFLSSFRDLLVLFRQLVDCCNHRANQDESLPRDSVWSVLTGHWPQGMSIPAPVMQELRQLETWLFTLLSSPVPVPGKTKLLLEALPPDMMPVPLEFALPDHTRFSLVDFPLHLPLELLGVDTVQQILAAIMLEYKVILQSRNYNAVSMCVMALVALLYPLEYMFPIIPLLPVFMQSAEQLLLAPTPYIIGLPASFFHCKGIQVPSDVMLVDLDTNQLCMPTDPTVRIPKFPAPEAALLKEEFLRAMGRQSNSSSNNNGVAHENGGAGANDGDEIDVNCRIAMIHFYNGPNVFANFSEHTRTIRLYPRPVVALQVDSFLRSRGQHNEFITELCKTQAVEYFAECSLCPGNETYVRVQAGVTSPQQIGDKAKWFAEPLMPVHFNAYPYGSTLSEAIFLARIDKSELLLERNDSDNIDDMDESDYPTTATPSDLESVGSADAGGWSPFGSRSPLNYEMPKPLSDANDVYRAPHRLELPQSESALSIDSSDMSSCRSSPISTVDSEADFARLAENMALKRNAKGDFTFDHPGQRSDEDETATIGEAAEEDHHHGRAESAQHSTKSAAAAQEPKVQMGHGERLSSSIFRGRPLLMGLNGYAERGQGVFNQMMRKTAPKAQALREKAKPLAEAMGTRMEASKMGQLLHSGGGGGPKQQLQSQESTASATSGVESERERQQRERESAAAAQQQRKNQHQLVEVCEQVLAGQGVGVFAGSKIRRLLEDESLRELVCSKLNLGLEVKYAEEEFIQDVQLSRQQHKGFLKLLQCCVSGLEHSFNTPGSNGLASAFHVFEIAHTHFWTQVESTGNAGQGSGGLQTPGSGNRSQLSSPSTSVQNLPVCQTPSSGSSSQNGPTPPAVQHSPAADGKADIAEGRWTTAPKRNSVPAIVAAAAGHPPPPVVPPPPLPAAALSTVFTIPPPSSAPPPLPARPPPLPPRTRPPSQSNEPPATARGDEMPTTHPPPLPRRPQSADGPQKVAPTESGRPLEIAVKDRVDIGQPAEKGTAERKQPPPTLNLKALEEMLPSSSGSSAELPPRHFLYQDLLGTTTSPSNSAGQNSLWQKMPFWETAFLDIVAQERDKIGMDQEPAEMIDRYAQLSEAERKRLELEEDRILATLLHNMTAMMHLCHVPLRTIQQKVRRMLGKAHIGLVYSKRINQLLDELAKLPANMKIPLKPLGSRLIQKMVFAVHEGSTVEGAMCFMEICDDAVILRASNGAIQERWWYERMVNMTFSPKTRVLCLWQRLEDQVHMYKFHTRKCRQLYNALKSAMERAASRGKYQTAGRDLGGEFPIHDVERNEGGLLQVRVDGIQLQFSSSQHLIELSNIKKCNTLGGNMFILEEYDRNRGQLIQRRYISALAPSIAWSLHRIFAIHAALGEAAQTETVAVSKLDQKSVTVYRSGRDPTEQRAVLPIRALSVDGQQQQRRSGENKDSNAFLASAKEAALANLRSLLGAKAAKEQQKAQQRPRSNSFSHEADQICYSVLCVFSFVAAHKNSSNHQQSKSSAAASSSLLPPSLGVAAMT